MTRRAAKGTSPRITLIVAMDRRRAIGKAGRMPWHLPAELKHFKSATWGKPIVMGRKTHDAIGTALPGRRNIVVSRNPDYAAPGCERAASLEQAIAAAGDGEIMIIGGAEIYAQALPLAERLLITEVATRIDGADAFFPEFDPTGWERRLLVEHPADAANRHAFRIVEYRRRREDDPAGAGRPARARAVRAP